MIFSAPRRREHLGCHVVGPVSRLDAALRLARDEPLDAAILDVHIRGGQVYPVAEELLARNIPSDRAGDGAPDDELGQGVSAVRLSADLVASEPYDELARIGAAIKRLDRSGGGLHPLEHVFAVAQATLPDPSGTAEPRRFDHDPRACAASPSVDSAAHRIRRWP